MFVSLYAFENNSSNTNHFYIIRHEGTGLFACAKGLPTKKATRIRLKCPKSIGDKLKSMREDFLLNKKVKC
jgi:hypothetical protein